MKMLQCPVCRKVKRANRRQTACSKQCAAILVKQRRGADFYRTLGQKAGRAAGITTRRKSIETWLRRFPGLPVEAVRAIWAQGYNSGHGKGRRGAFLKGYEQALRDTDPNYAKECDLLDRGGHVRALGLKGAKVGIGPTPSDALQDWYRKQERA